MAEATKSISYLELINAVIVIKHGTGVATSEFHRASFSSVGNI